MKWILIIAHFAIAGEPMNAVLSPKPFATEAQCVGAAEELYKVLEDDAQPGTIYCYAVDMKQSGKLNFGGLI